MADNVTLPGTGVSVAADDIGGVQHQLVKVEFGVDGAATQVSASNPLPVTNGQLQPLTDAELRASAVPVSGTVALDATSLAALETINVGNLPATQTVAGTVALDAPTLAALETISVANFPATQPVSIAATVAVAGPLTDTQLRATAVPVSNASLPLPTGAATETSLAGVRTDLGTDGSSPPAVLGAGTGVRGWLRSIYEKLTGSIAVTGTFFQATQPVSIAATVAVSGPLTDTQLRATPVPVSGTVTATGPLTDTQLRASAVPVSLATLPALTTGANVIGAVTQSGTWTVTQQTLTKSTQGATGVTTQDLKDAGRSARSIFLDSFAVAATAETLMTMSYSTDNGTATTGTSYTVTAAKRLRIQCISAGLHTIAGNTTAVNVIIRVRTIATAPALVGSPIQFVLPIQGIAAANQAGMPVFIDFPDGWELPAGAGLAVTVACAGFVATTAAPKVDITINAYEY